MLKINWRKLYFIFIIIFFIPIYIFAEELSKSQIPVLTLEECIKYALANNPKLQQAVSTVGINKAKTKEAKADYLPEVSTTTSYAHASGNAGLATAGTVATKGSAYLAQTTLEQLIWDFGQTLNQIKLAKENLSAAEYTFLETQENMILNTKKAYFEVLKTQLLVDTTSENLAQSKLHWGKTKGFYEVGLKQKFDLTKEEVNVSKANLDYVKAKKNYELAKAFLNNIIGKIKDTNYRAEEIQEVKPLEINLKGAIEIATKNRNEILKKEAELKATQANLEIKKRGNWPKLTIDTSYGAKDTSTTTAVDSLNFGFLLKWPWFDSFKTQSQIEAAEENLKIARANFQGEILDVILEVQDAVFSLEEVKEKIKTSDKILQEATQNLEIIAARYQEGLSSALEVNDAESTLVSAKKNYIMALADYLIAQANYEKAIGIIGQKGEGR